MRTACQVFSIIEPKKIQSLKQNMKQKKPAFGKTALSASKTALLAFAALAGFNNISNASQIAYEGFNYTAGTSAAIGLANAGSSTLNGGTGWAASAGWAQNQSGTLVNHGDTYAASTPGLTYGDSTVVGNAFNVAGKAGSTGGSGAQVFRQLAAPVGFGTAGSGGDLWLSVIGQDSNSNGRYFFLSLFSSTSGFPSIPAANDLLDIGHPSTTTGQLDWGLNSGATYADGGTLATVESFLLLDISSIGTASLWINPNLDNGQAGLGTAQATLSGINGTFDYIRLGAGQYTGATGLNANGIFDEINIGTTFADVSPITPAPEPASTALFGIGLAGLLAANHRRKQLLQVPPPAGGGGKMDQGNESHRPIL
jgi:hypothetical protein